MTHVRTEWITHYIIKLEAINILQFVPFFTNTMKKTLKYPQNNLITNLIQMWVKSYRKLEQKATMPVGCLL